MAYQVLSRKWRPQVFEDVVGQEHITDVLKNSLESGRLHHGYLFVGIRGIGKTTTARILAKALNCEHGPTPQPCNQCEFCREITDGYSMDVEEVDGASNRGVDEVRVLQESVGYAPSRSRYKIFIIDEVHMLTTEAFNALLKTLEEPPENVVFIMATTEPWKIPATILSRCQQFTFKNGSSEQLVGLLKKITQHEQISISNRGLALLAKSSGGSVRDAENLLDQVHGFCGSPIEDADVRYVLGIPEQTVLDEVLTALFTHKTSHIFSLMERVVSQGYNLRFFCMELMERIRNIVVLKLSKQPDRYLHLFDYTRDDLARYESRTTLSELQQIYWRLDDTERNMRFSPNPRYILEMALAGMTRVQNLAPMEELYAQLQEIQAQLERSEASMPSSAPSCPSASPSTPEMSHTAAPASGMPTESEPIESIASSDELNRLWGQLLAGVRQTRPALVSRLKIGRPVALTQNEFTVGFDPTVHVSREAFDNPKNAGVVEGVLLGLLGRPVKMVTTSQNGGMSVESVREQLEANVPHHTIQAQEFTPPVKSSKSERRAAGGSNGEGGSGRTGTKGVGKWQKQHGKSRHRYKPSVQVTVQDLVNLFEGTIEE
ncbi:DNA polymerase III subunit gamma/tau [candidate division KSB3 bacterium]|uniref:DNA polymerase III subunit gamma/tau n=1 Tax=candidate division KSB3 bacterium TaxID=2044937 RepID=A0A2G6KFD6_9BACT|nr:MAG: DNA polymerase III subunit gamma/tau [candidate division KSB3 bacterium]